MPRMSDPDPPEAGFLGIPWIVWILMIGLVIAAELCGQGESSLFRAVAGR
jgi:hypothetical protein